jgi:RNA recognition motif-containing protein
LRLFLFTHETPLERRMAMNIYVGNLSHKATEEDVRQAFEAFGQVSSAAIIKDKYSGQARGFGFVEMPDKTEAQAAIQNLNGKELLGQALNVNEARPREDRNRAGGQGGNRGERGGYSGGGGGGRNRY